MPTNQKISATFSQAMNSATILAAGTFTVTRPGVTPVPGTVTYDSTNFIATFTPTGGVFAVSTTFTATITTAAQSSAGALPLASNYVWTFKTGASTDTSAPLVLRTNPVNLSTAAATNQKVTATFNEEMDSSTITTLSFTLLGPGAIPVLGTVTYSTSAATRPLRRAATCYRARRTPRASQPRLRTSVETRWPVHLPGPSPLASVRTVHRRQ
jgi:Big-like domain-containing protein